MDVLDFEKIILARTCGYSDYDEHFLIKKSSGGLQMAAKINGGEVGALYGDENCYLLIAALLKLCEADKWHGFHEYAESEPTLGPIDLDCKKKDFFGLIIELTGGRLVCAGGGRVYPKNFFKFYNVIRAVMPAPGETVRCGLSERELEASFEFIKQLER